MPIDWKSPESYSRLLAALVAASDNNIDYKKVAYYFGQGATYDSIEGRFRIAKRSANELKGEAEREGRQMPTTRSKNAATTPRRSKAKSGPAVANGRVQKTPSKRGSRARAPAPAPKPEPQLPMSPNSDHTRGEQQQQQEQEQEQQQQQQDDDGEEVDGATRDDPGFSNSSDFLCGDGGNFFGLHSDAV